MNPEPTLTRREALKTIGGVAAALGFGALATGRASAALPAAPAAGAASAAGLMQPFALPPLPYAFDALEPHIDARTMQLHYTKHHQGYVNNANAALQDHPQLQALSAAQILQRLPEMPDAIRTTLRNNVGGHANHSFFWEVLGPDGGEPAGALARALARDFGSEAAFREQFAAAAGKRFGSGWAWLVAKDGALSISTTANQDSPLSDGTVPVLGLDVWEHAYYLKYQNVRADYVKAFWNVVSWRRVGANYDAATA